MALRDISISALRDAIAAFCAIEPHTPQFYSRKVRNFVDDTSSYGVLHHRRAPGCPSDRGQLWGRYSWIVPNGFSCPSWGMVSDIYRNSLSYVGICSVRWVQGHNYYCRTTAPPGLRSTRHSSRLPRLFGFSIRLSRPCPVDWDTADPFLARSCRSAGLELACSHISRSAEPCCWSGGAFFSHDARCWVGRDTGNSAPA